MENWYFILFDLVFLALLGLLFYYFQKKRIIRSAKLELIDQINTFILTLPEDYRQFLKVSLENQAWEELHTDFQKLPKDLRKPEDKFQKLIQDLEFFIKN